MSTPEHSSSASKGAVSRKRGWRLEVGVFVRKVVNRRIVSEWQFPARRRLSVSQQSGSGEPVLQQATAPPVPPARETGAPTEGEPEALALRSTTAADGGDDGSTSKKTRLEVGFFVQSTVPPEYKDPPEG